MAQTIGSLDLNAFSDLYSDSTQYFWFESDSTATYGAGVHVTLVPDTSFISNPTGQNILMNTDGFSIRNGLLPMMTLDNDSLDFNVVDTTAGTYKTTATFTATSAQIGQIDGAHSVLDANGQRFYATDGTTQLANIGYGEGTAQSGTDTAPYYTFGVRSNNSAIGNYSTAEGYNTTASGYCSHAEGTPFGSPNDGSMATSQGSHAEGRGTQSTALGSHAEGGGSVASGNYSHAQNFLTIAQGAYQTALGQYNVADTTSAVIIGNGTSQARSNALTIDWNGDVNLTGQAKTSFKSSIAMGSYGSSQTTVPNLVEEVRFSSGCCGSVNIGTAYTANNVTIATGWYNFMYMPHRSGGVNGSASGDNCNYGNLFLFGMNNTNGRFIVRVSSSAIAEVAKIFTSIERYTRSNAGDLAWSSQADGDAKVIMKSALAFWNGAYNGTGSNLRYSANGEIIGTNTSPSTITVSASSTTTGTLNSSTCRRYGKVVQLTLSIKNTAAVASGSNFYKATLSSAVPTPIAKCTGSSFWGGRAISGYIDTSRNVIIRNASGSSITLGSSDTVDMSFTYLTT